MTVSEHTQIETDGLHFPPYLLRSVISRRRGSQPKEKDAEQRKEMEAKQRKELKELLTAFIDGDLQTPPLCTAATGGDLGAVIALLDKLGADKNFKDRLGCTPLIRAADNGHLSVVETLLAAGVDVNTTDPCGSTALHGAAQKGYDGIVGALLKTGAEKDARDDTGGTPRWLQPILVSCLS